MNGRARPATRRRDPALSKPKYEAQFASSPRGGAPSPSRAETQEPNAGHRSKRLRLALVAGAFGLVGCSSTPTAPSPPAALAPPTHGTPPRDVPAVASACAASAGVDLKTGFTRYTVDSAATGAAFVAVADINKDGKKDLVVSKFGPLSIHGSEVTLSPGEVSVYLQGENLGCWEKHDIVTTADKIYFPNLPTLDDVDGDGDLDVIQPSGFFVCGFDKNVKACGAIRWFENAAGTWKRHEIVAPSTTFYHKATLVDIDGDGIRDLVTGGESAAVTRWFKGENSPARFASKPLDIGAGGGSFPVVSDIDGDGDLDIASAEFFVDGESFTWFERKQNPSPANPAGLWQRHIFNADSGRSLMFDFVPNLYGDGVTRGIGTNHTNIDKSGDNPDTVGSAVFEFDIPPNPADPWKKTVISTDIVCRANVGQALKQAPGVFGHGDIDGDGDIDIAVAGDGDAHTYWLEQTGPGAFKQHTIENSLGQASGALVVDLNGDGASELVFTGYEDNVVNVYARHP